MIADHIRTIIGRSSWIREMFEAGARLKAQHGPENVCDFSIGNPNLEPPDAFKRALKETVDGTGPMGHAYMPNAGFASVRKAVADYLSSEQAVDVSEHDIVMTCGAAGALNAILKAILNPGDEVITPSPFFMEYTFYTANHGGVLKTVPTHSDFTLDLDALSAGITERTRAVLVNSPNNPTGQIYSAKSLDAVGALLREKSKAHGNVIYLVADESYRKITYDGHKVPSVFACYPDSMLAVSYSKDLSIPGERLGYAAVNPRATYRDDLQNALGLANRILGFINAPALVQRVVGQVQGALVDVAVYARKRERLCAGLSELGYDFVKPSGTFYVFPKTPIPDDVAFVKDLQQELILTVPGSGFGGPGHFRIAYCVDDRTIENAMPGFERAMARYR